MAAAMCHRVFHSSARKASMLHVGAALDYLELYITDDIID